MTTLELRNLYAKKISKSLNKVLEQIDLLNNIDNNIILNNNFTSSSESKIYNNNLYGGAESKTEINDPDCNLTNFNEIEMQLNNSLATYNTIETNITQLINMFKTQIQEKDSEIEKQKQELLTISQNNQNMVDRDAYDKVRNECKNRLDAAKNEKASYKKQVKDLQSALQKCTDCKTTYVQKLGEMKQQVDINNDAVSKLLNKVQNQLDTK